MYGVHLVVSQQRAMHTAMGHFLCAWQAERFGHVYLLAMCHSLQIRIHVSSKLCRAIHGEHEDVLEFLTGLLAEKLWTVKVG